MVTKFALTACTVLIAFPITGRERKPNGEIFDPRVLREVRTYCIEEGGLSGSDRYIVDGFLRAESKPKHLLTKMPWKLVEGCGTDSPDAIATVEFLSLNSIDIATGDPTGPPMTGTDSRDPESPIKVVLTVDDSSQ